MRKAFIAFVIAVISISILSGTLARKNGNPCPSVKNRPGPQNSAPDPPDTQTRQAASGGAAVRPSKDQAEPVAQVLTDISDANIAESTRDLRYAFDRLNGICEKAVNIRHAMLAARYDDKQDHTLDNEKGTEGDRQ